VSELGREIIAAIKESRWLADHDERVKAEAKAEQAEADAQIVENNLGRKWIATETIPDLAAAIRAAAENGESNDPEV